MQDVNKFMVGSLSLAWIGSTLVMFGYGWSAFMTATLGYYQVAVLSGMIGAVSMSAILFHLRTR